MPNVATLTAQLVANDLLSPALEQAKGNVQKFAQTSQLVDQFGRSLTQAMDTAAKSQKGFSDELGKFSTGSAPEAISAAKLMRDALGSVAEHSSLAAQAFRFLTNPLTILGAALVGVVEFVKQSVEAFTEL